MTDLVNIGDCEWCGALIADGQRARHMEWHDALHTLISQGQAAWVPTHSLARLAAASGGQARREMGTGDFPRGGRCSYPRGSGRQRR